MTGRHGSRLHRPGNRRAGRRLATGLVVLAVPVLAAAPAAALRPRPAATPSAAAASEVSFPGGLGRLESVLADGRQLGLGAPAMSATVSPPADTATGSRAGFLQAIRLSGSGGVPAAVLQAYQRASERTATTTPGCRLEWSVLAGIGRVESNNGRDGIGITTDGTIRPPILGPVLDGSAGTAAISDSDGGRLDGDPVWDRAVGPMQFLPSSWVATGIPGDPNNINDAALAAARYLCSGGRNLADPRQLAAAVFSYNHSDAYVATVLAWIAAYDRAGPGGVPVAPLPVAAPAPAPQPTVRQLPLAPAPPPAPAPPTAPAPPPAPALAAPRIPVIPTPTPSPSGTPTPTPLLNPAPPTPVPAPAKQPVTIAFVGSTQSVFGVTTLRAQVLDVRAAAPVPLAGHRVIFTADTATYRAVTGVDGIAVVTPADPLTAGRHQVTATLEPTDDYAGRSATQVTVDTTAGSVRGRELTFADGGTGVINARWDGTKGRLDLTVPGLSLDAVQGTAMGISADDSRVTIGALDSTGRPLVVTVGTDSDGAQTVSVRSTEAVVLPSTAVTAGRIEVSRSE